MSELKCFYHPNIIANDKCEQCGKLLCLQCKIVDYSYSSEGGGYRYILCPDCHKKNKKIVRIGIAIIIPIFLICLILTLISAFS